MFKHLRFTVGVCVIVVAFLAQQAYSANPTPVGISAAFSGYPRCVVPGMNAKFPLRITNSDARARVITVQLSYITKLAGADPYSVVITNGTDHLSGVQGGEFWRFRLAPGQSITKHLVARIQWPFENKRGPAMYSVSEEVTAADIPGLQLWATAQVPYCA